MSDDDDDLGIDLDAWQPPPAPGGIADAVVAQLRQEHTAITTVTAIDTERRGSKRLWLVAIPLAAAAAVGLVAFGIRRAPSSGQGTAVAERPMHLALGPSSAELDPGTRVTWRRDRYRITATQTNGAATWRVDEDDTLTIDAAVAKIEATNASVRVEVKMIDDNQKRTIATSAVTAAAVALVTIVVYEGSVNAIADGKTTQVAAGSAYQIKGPSTVIEEEAVVGASTEELVARIEELERERRDLLTQIEEAKTVEPEKQEAIEQLDASNKPASLTRTEIQKVMTRLSPDLRACGDGFEGRITTTVTVGPDGTVARVDVDPADAKPASCISGVIKAATFSKTKQITTFKYPIVFSNPAPAPKSTCDFDELYAKGQDAYGAGSYAEALAAFEGAYLCRADTQALKLTFAAACRSKNLPKAQRYWRKLTQNMKDQVLSLCVGSGFTPEQLNAKLSTGRARIVGPAGAEIHVDGLKVAVGAIELDLVPGKHKVTFRVGDDRHTFSLLVKAGQTITLDKRGLE